MDVDVDPDEVEERARPHRPSGAVRHRRVERLGRDPRLVQDPDAVVEQRDQDPVDHEPGRVVAGHGDLPHPFDDGKRGRDHVVGRELGAHHLDEGHQRRRVEVVHPDDPLRCRRRRGDLGHRERGGVRRENGVRAADPFQIREERLLGVELLDDRLDHEVAPGEVGEVGRRLQARDRGVVLILGALPLLDLAGEEVADARGRGVAELGTRLAAHDVEPGLDRDLRDPGAHRAEADDPDPLHGLPLSRHGRGAYTGPASALVVAPALDVVDARVAPTEERERPDDEEKDDECEFHGLHHG